MDREDVFVLGGAGLVSAGAWCVSPAYGLIASGLMLFVVVFVSRLLGAKK